MEGGGSARRIQWFLLLFLVFILFLFTDIEFMDAGKVPV